LERVADNVVAQPPYRDIFQRAFYGRSQQKLSVLCEDAVAEALILGVMDRVNPLLNLTPDDIAVGRETGKNQFAQHIDTLGKFRLLDEFVFVLDGDARDVEPDMAAAAQRHNKSIDPLYLPGTTPPEDWIYQTLEDKSQLYSQLLGAPNLAELLSNLRLQFDNATDKPTNIMKARFATLADSLQRTQQDIARVVGREGSQLGPLKVFADELSQAVSNWRARSAN
jgi:hypothetical protein